MVKKSGLGKGLESLMGEANAEVGSVASDTVLPLDKIKPNKNQPRQSFEAEPLSELADSIKQNGVLQPIMVRKVGAKYEIVAGERRYQAAKIAGLKEIPVLIREVSDEDVFKLALIENLQRSDLNPIEEAKAYKSLIEEYNLTQEELSERISKSRTQITNTMRLLKLHDKVQKMLIDGSISAGHARALLGLEIQEEQLLTAQKIVAENLSVRQTEDLVRQINNPPKSKKASPKIKNSVFYKDLEKRMTEALGTKVKINQKEQGKGRIEISYFSEDELDRIFTIINSSI